MSRRPIPLAPRRRGLDEMAGILCLAGALVILAGSWFDRRGLVPQAVGQLLESLGVGTYYLVVLLGLLGITTLSGKRPRATALRATGLLVIAPLFAATIEGIYLLSSGYPASPLAELVSGTADAGPGGRVGLFVYGRMAGLLGAWSTLFLLLGLTLALSTFLADLGAWQLVGACVRTFALGLRIVHRTIKAPLLFALRVLIAALLGLHHLIYLILKDIVTLTVRASEALAGGTPAEVTAGAAAMGGAGAGAPPMLGDPGAPIESVPIPIVGRAPAPPGTRGASAALDGTPDGDPAQGGGHAGDAESEAGTSTVGLALARSVGGAAAGDLPVDGDGEEHDKHADADAGDALSSLLGPAPLAAAGPGSRATASGSPAAALPGVAAGAARAARPATTPAQSAGKGTASGAPAPGQERAAGNTHAHTAAGETAGGPATGGSSAGGVPSSAARATGAGDTAGASSIAAGSASLAGAPREGDLPAAGPGRAADPPQRRGPTISAQRQPADAPRPPETLFNIPPGVSPDEETEEELRAKAARIVETLAHFKIQSEVTQITRGPSVTQFELRPQAGIKLSTISSLSSNLAMSLETKSVRIEAPILGKSVVGIEVPNRTMAVVSFRKIVASPRFKASRSLLTFAIGEDITGQPVIGDMAKLPHLLVAGATGSGKSVCINTILASLLTNAGPDIVNFILIDPKMVELSVYSGIPHLVTDVVTDPADAAAALKWAVLEMERRYRYLSRFGIRNIRTFNEAKAAGALRAPDGETPLPEGPMPYIVVIIDELADLMVVAKKDVEESIMRLTQMARAVGIHLVVATQRPSVNVITGVIKANLPSRIAFAVASKVDSKVILDAVGAEKLLGRGDMLYLPTGEQRPQRIQGAYIDDEEVKRLVSFLKEHGEPIYQDIVAEVKEAKGGPKSDKSFADKMFNDCLRFALEKGEASTSLFQTYLDIGYNRAARIVEEMEARGIISGRETGKRRKVLISPGDVDRYLV